MTPLPAGYGNVLSEHAAAGLDAQFSGAASTANSTRHTAPSAYPLPYPGYAPPDASPPPVPPPALRMYTAPAVARLEDDTATQHGEALPAYTLEDADREAAVRIEQSQARTAAAGARREPDTAGDTTADLLARLRLAEEAQAQAEAARRDLEARLAAAEAAALAKTGAIPSRNASSSNEAKPPLAQLLVSQMLSSSDAPTATTGKDFAASADPSASVGSPR